MRIEYQAAAGVRGIDRFLRAGYRDFGGRLSDRQLHRQVQFLGDLKHDVGPLQTLKSVGKDLDIVGTRIKIRNSVGAVGGSFHFLYGVGGNVGGFNRCSWNRRTRGIGDGSGQRGPKVLSEKRR